LRSFGPIVTPLVMYILASPGGALLLFVSFKLTLPLGTFLACVLPWPAVIGKQTVSAFEAVGGAFVFSATFLFLAGGRLRKRLSESGGVGEEEDNKIECEGGRSRSPLMDVQTDPPAEQHRLPPRNKSSSSVVAPEVVSGRQTRRICMYPFHRSKKQAACAFISVLAPPVLFLIYSLVRVEDKKSSVFGILYPETESE